MRKILIVDDSAFMRRMLIKIITKHGYTVVGEATNGREGVTKFKELSPDIVTMDVTMNEMTGLEALREITEYQSGAKIVMVSSMGQAPIIKEAIRLGATGFLVKPFEEEAVISVLSKL